MKSRSSIPTILLLWSAAFVFVATALFCECTASAGQPSITWNAASGRAVLTNGRLELIVETKSGINPCSLRDVKSGRVYADGDYSWPEGKRPKLAGKPVITEEDGVCTITLKGKLKMLKVEQTFSASVAEPDVITEQIKLRNPRSSPVETPWFACGFTKKLRDGGSWLPGVADSRLCDVPYRRHPETGELCDWTVPELVARKNWYSTARSAIYNRQESCIYGAEGWAWYQGGNTLLISKYNPDAMEWSLLEATPNGATKSLLSGGVVRSKLGDRKDAATITVYPAPGKANAPAVVICPGGGYAGLMTGPEGHQIAQWLNRHGIAGVVLEYRLPAGRAFVPLHDAQRAIRTVRFNAKQWGINPARVGILGFSAGGHLASTAATHFDGGDRKATDPVNRLSCRPDFGILIYPVITMSEKTHGGSRANLLGPDPKPEMVTLFSNEKQVTDKTPPMFLAHAKDDTLVAPTNSRMMYEALRAHGVAAEFLELPSGGHGLNGYQGPMWEAWKSKSLEWLAARKIAAASVEKSLRFGGAGRWKLGDPEGAAHLAPGDYFTFGQTRYQVVDGDWRQGYAAFRRFTASKGHVTPPKFNPPVHWNELYDNKLWWLADAGGLVPENLKKYYQKKDMEAEAEKAKEIGCGCLYLDPGWDTSFGSNIWGTDRLGTEESFVRWLKDKYGFPLALHTPLAPWSTVETYPLEARRMDKAGNRLGELCVASPAYQKAKLDRLKTLCKNGAYFLMYDGSWFPGECWDKSHGHSLPVKHQEHVDAILKLQQGLHKEYPNVLIEQHDPMTGPGTPRYVPTYFMHGKPGAFDELWGYEYMITAIDDVVVSRRAGSLYYVNLAYGIPVYLHFDLRTDNSQAIAFWWFASTCRHLGFGGKPTDPAVWTAHKNAMKTYNGLKRFFAQGVFFGLDETIHCHTLPDEKRSVINCFNLEDKPVKRQVRFRLSEIGLPAGKVQIDEAPFRQSGEEVTVDLAIPARGHLLLQVQPAK
jgi:acetyl esterase/lipase